MWSHKSVFQEEVDVSILISSSTKSYINVFTSFYILNICIENSENNRNYISNLLVKVLTETETFSKIKKWIQFFC